MHIKHQSGWVQRRIAQVPAVLTGIAQMWCRVLKGIARCLREVDNTPGHMPDKHRPLKSHFDASCLRPYNSQALQDHDVG